MTTTVVIREDTNRQTHQICAQSQVNTCAAASLFMIQCIKERRSAEGGEDEIHRLAGRANMTWGMGLEIPIVANLLNRLTPVRGIATMSANRKQGVILSNLCHDEHPALVVVAWFGPQESIVGFHAVVAPRFLNGRSKIVYLDPWQGQLVEQVNDGKFSSASGVGKVFAVCYT